MSNYNNDNDWFGGCVYAFCIGCVVINFFIWLLKKDLLFTYAIPVLSILLLIMSITDKIRLNNYRKICNQKSSEYNKLKNDLLKEHKKLIDDYELKEEKLQKEKVRMHLLMTVKNPFRYSASLCADMKVFIYATTEKYLIKKDHPALKAADNIKELRKLTRGYISMYEEMLYKYEFLIKTFPELEKYIDDDEALVSLENYDTFTSFQDDRDRVSDYLSLDEWNKLTTDERNQLALNRYKTRKKSNWIIGIEYEMYVEYVLRSKGFTTIPFGSLNGVEDLGRDIIAKKVDKTTGLLKWYIIQCKNWSINKEKEIHENVVCQTFGTSIEYELNNNLTHDRVVPIIATTVPFSEMAVKFASKLGVVQWNVPKGEFPMIKCNIGKNGERIYHLPFDQQYYRTEINKPGEFYAWTIQEATKAGFRRAMKYTQIN